MLPSIPQHGPGGYWEFICAFLPRDLVIWISWFSGCPGGLLLFLPFSSRLLKVLADELAATGRNGMRARLGRGLVDSTC